MARAKFTSHGSDGVTLEYTDDCDLKQVRTFCVRGAYVYELFGYEGRAQQVCDRLEHRGSTLSAPADKNLLIETIRREYKAMRAAERREAGRY